MIYQPKGGGRRVKQQLKSHFLLVDFYLYLAKFQIKRAGFFLVFPAYVKFGTKIAVLHFFKDTFQQPTFLADL